MCTPLTHCQDIFFRNYQVASKYHDQINMDVQTDMIVSALKSAADSPAITMRLGKRGASPHLAFSILTDVVCRPLPSPTNSAFESARLLTSLRV